MNRYILSAVGDKAAKQLNIAIRFLKKFSKLNITTISSRTNIKLNGDKNIVIDMPKELNDLEGSRYIKTNLPMFLDKLEGLYCYIDNDVYVVSEDCDKIFEEYQSPITFSDDYGQTVDDFSKGALYNGLLSKEIERKFKLKVNPDWRIYNSGVILFDSTSIDFFKTWQKYELEIFKDSNWKKRDQGVLVAAVWKHKLQNNKRLSSRYNWLIRHTAKVGSKLKFKNRSFYHDNTKVHFLHFIHDKINEPYSYVKEYRYALGLISKGNYESFKNNLKIFTLITLKLFLHPRAFFADANRNIGERTKKLKKKYNI